MAADSVTFRPFPDGNGAELSINGASPLSVSTKGIDRLIVALIGLRAHLNPRRVEGSPEPDTEMMSGPELSWAVGAGPEKGTAQVALFHPGLGWWCAELDAAETMEAAGILTELASEMRGGRAN